MKRNYRRGATNQADSESLRSREAGHDPQDMAPIKSNFGVVLQGLIDPHSGRLSCLKISNYGLEIRSISSEKGHLMFEGVVEAPRVTQLLKRITE